MSTSVLSVNNMLSDSMVPSAAGAWVFLSALAVQVQIPFASAKEAQSSPSHAFEAPGIPEAQPWKYRADEASAMVKEIMDAYDASIEKEPPVPFAMGKLLVPTPKPTIRIEVLEDEEDDEPDLRWHHLIPVKVEQDEKQSSQSPHHVHHPGVAPAPEQQPVTPEPVDSNPPKDDGYDQEHEQELSYKNYLLAREAKDVHQPIVEDRDPGIIRVDRVDYPYAHRYHHNHLNLPAGNEFRPELTDDKYARPVIQKPPKPVNRPKPEFPIYGPDYSGSCGAVESGSGCGFVSLGQEDVNGRGRVARARARADDNHPIVSGDEVDDRQFQGWFLTPEGRVHLMTSEEQFQQLDQGYIADDDTDSEDSLLAEFEDWDFRSDSEAEVGFNTPTSRPRIQPGAAATPEEPEHLDFHSEATILAPQSEVATCTRTKGRLRTQRRWSITYKGDSVLNPKHCGKSVLKHLKWKLRCKPITDWTCVKSGKEGEDQVTVGFHTPRTCKDKLVHDAVKKGTKGRVDVWCKHE